MYSFVWLGIATSKTLTDNETRSLLYIISDVYLLVSWIFRQHDDHSDYLIRKSVLSERSGLVMLLFLCGQ